MTSTNGSSGNGHHANGHSGNGSAPEGSVIGGQRPEGIDNGEYGWSQIGVHDLVPKTGYREYWYPAIEASKVGRKKYGFFGSRYAKRVKMLGEDVVIFRGEGRAFRRGLEPVPASWGSALLRTLRVRGHDQLSLPRLYLR